MENVVTTPTKGSQIFFIGYFPQAATVISYCQPGFKDDKTDLKNYFCFVFA